MQPALAGMNVRQLSAPLVGKGENAKNANEKKNARNARNPNHLRDSAVNRDLKVGPGMTDICRLVAR